MFLIYSSFTKFSGKYNKKTSKGKTSYPYKSDIRYWTGAYICCGRGDLLHKTEPDHLLIYDMVKVKVVK